MYNAHFKLKRSPFEVSPDPWFLFRTPRHNEALASIYYAIKQHKGFVVLTGEVGTGKTLLLKCVLSLLDPSKFNTAYVFNPRFNTMEFLRYVMTDFGIRCSETKGQILQELNRFLIAERQRGMTTVLAIDEAQHLDNDVLEEIRLLTNLESTREKMLQIVLAGQPELDNKFDSVALRQLKQRIALRCHLEPLDAQATAEYIHCRLKVAGATPEAIRALFPPETLALVYRYSKGIPRLINTVCDNAMIATYAKGALSIAPAVVDEIAADLRLEVCTRLPSKVLAPADFSMVRRLLLMLDAYEQDGARLDQNPLVRSQLT